MDNDNKADVLVVGAGIIGILIALELHAAGAKVLLLERNAEIAAESTWAGGGILSPLYPWRYSDAVMTLAQYGQQHYPDLAGTLLAATGIDPEYLQSGLLMFAGDDQALDPPADWLMRWQQDARPLSASQAAAMLPGTPAAGPALWWPQLGQIRNARLIRALRAYLAVLGIPVRSGVSLQRPILANGRLHALDTSAGRMTVGQAVVSAGAWTGALLNLNINPVKGQMLLLRGEPGLLQQVILKGDTYLVPRRDGRILVGSTVEHVGFDKQPTQAAFDGLMSAAHAICPALAQTQVESHWAGLRPGSPQGIPVISAVTDAQGLFVCAGHFRNGIVMAPASARLLADLLLGRPPSFDVSAYAWPGHVKICA